MKLIQLLGMIIIAILITIVPARAADGDDELLLLDDVTAVDDNFKAYASTCTLKVFPEKIYNRRIGRFGLIVVSGIDTDLGDVVDWGTDDIVTICGFRFPKRIFNIVWIKRDAEPAVYDVAVGDDNCTGTIEIR